VSGHELLDRCRAVLDDVDKELRDALGAKAADQLAALILRSLDASAAVSGKWSPPDAN
jgi:hypothetical protein